MPRALGPAAHSGASRFRARVVLVAGSGREPHAGATGTPSVAGARRQRVHPRGAGRRATGRPPVPEPAGV